MVFNVLVNPLFSEMTVFKRASNSHQDSVSGLLCHRCLWCWIEQYTWVCKHVASDFIFHHLPPPLPLSHKKRINSHFDFKIILNKNSFLALKMKRIHL